MVETKNILVTGGAGFIGSHLVDELLERGHNVVVLDNLRNGSLDSLRQNLSNNAFRFVEGDVTNFDVGCLATAGIDTVYHLACLGVRHSIHSPMENHKVNAEGTLALLQAALKNKVRKFFYISSSEIYGDVSRFPIDEAVLPNPSTVYGASKLVGEHYTNAFYRCYGLATTVLRIFNNYGPRAHYEGDAGELIPRTIVNILYGLKPIIFGDGHATRDFIYVEDTAKILVNLLDHPEIFGETINIGTGIEITIKNLVETLLLLMGKESLGIKYLDPRPGDLPRLWVDTGKLLRLTGLKPTIMFEEGLKQTITFYRELAKDKNLVTVVREKNWEI